MSYPFVAAYWEYGPRKGPTLGIGLHMAEGGGTVGYLDKIGTIPPRGVSVHAVCDRAGVVTQMLKWGDASGSLNPANRSTEKGYYGHSILVAVLGTWWTDPNSAIVSMEIEGMATTGPDPAQVKAAIAWGLDMRRMFPSIRGAFGHADQTDTKGCPGTTAAMKAIFAGIGGHGLFTTATGGADVLAVVKDIVRFKVPRTFMTKPGTTLNGYDPAKPGVVVKSYPIKLATPGTFAAVVSIEQSPNATVVPHGAPFLEVLGGTYAGLYIVASLVTADLTSDAAPVAAPKPPVKITVMTSVDSVIVNSFTKAV